MAEETGKMKERKLSAIGVRIEGTLRYNFGVRCKVLEFSERGIIEELIRRWLLETEEEFNRILAIPHKNVEEKGGTPP